MWVLLGGAILSGVQAAPKTDTLSIEERQQFLYYFYAAQRLIQAEAVEPAWELVQFCYDIDPNDAATNNYMAVFLDVFNRKEEAVPYLRRAYELQPTEYWYPYTLYLLQSQDKKKEKAAIRHLLDVSKLAPKDDKVFTMLQKAYIHVGDYKRALAVQNNLDSLLGYNAMSAMQRYRLNAMIKNNQQAIYEIERYLEEDPDNVQFHAFRAQLYEETHQPSEKMIIAYTALLRFDARNLMLMNNLAWHMCLTNTDLDKAEQLSRTTILAEPSNPTYLDTYAWILYMKGDYENAFFYIQRAKENIEKEDDEEKAASKKEILMHYKAILKKLEL